MSIAWVGCSNFAIFLEVFSTPQQVQIMLCKVFVDENTIFVAKSNMRQFDLVNSKYLTWKRRRLRRVANFTITGIDLNSAISCPFDLGVCFNRWMLWIDWTSSKFNMRLIAEIVVWRFSPYAKGIPLIIKSMFFSRLLPLISRASISFDIFANSDFVSLVKTSIDSRISQMFLLASET